ncbi:hypothetical protein [Dactylococcopsis salina]|uniref:DUF1868 domain-containing protein n=1 Tax=Dactylococcopsis salina (strain PCC 8305) TaxID=13035 RepID=K9YU05_DACS8|nr:hypothetical protein [Dactylococcopsis salina]AFZ49593.1 hypothetical protein Dacsa_0847 [Dactylococcopsis salina PCC 8305]
MDEAYQKYVEQVGRLSQPSLYPTQLKNIQESPKFQRDETGKVEARSFPGYSVVTPPYQDDSSNEGFYHHLAQTQKRLLSQLPQDFILPVPPPSFHVTLADLIWGDEFQSAVAKNPEFETQLKAQIAASFEQYQRENYASKPLQWQLLGLIIRPRAIVVGLLPKDDHSYQQVLQLRRAIYQNQGLLSLGLEQHYHFLAHVTLGYFGKVPPESEKDAICTTLTAINDQWLEIDPKILTVDRAELRKFSDMTSFTRDADFPVINFREK